MASSYSNRNRRKNLDTPLLNNRKHTNGRKRKFISWTDKEGNKRAYSLPLLTTGQQDALKQTSIFEEKIANGDLIRHYPFTGAN